MIEEKKSVKSEQTVYSYAEAVKASEEYFGGDEMPAKVFVDKYALKDLNGNIYESTPMEMHWRLAKEFARMELKFHNKENADKMSAYGQSRKILSVQKIFDYFNDFKYVIPQGSVMEILGNTFKIGSLSNCIVLPEIYDSYGGIHYTDQQMTQLMKRRCGCGIDISTLRPEGAKVTNAAGSSTGPVSFMERFSNTTREVAQSGRRGALMITIDIAHPDVEKFITIKEDTKLVTGANISVKLSDEFMEAVKNDTDFTLRWPIENPDPKYSKVVRAKDLWDVIIKAAHRSAEPGLIFWDRQHKYSTSSVYPGYKNLSTNPCSEIAMQGGDSCRLIAMNLYGCVVNPFTPAAYFDFEKFYEVTYESQRMMDDLVELELEAIQRIVAKILSDPEPTKIKTVELDIWNLLSETGKKGRRTGLGFTALGDAMAAIGLKFDSAEGLEFIDKLMQTKLRGEFDSSIDMAIERGQFEGYNNDIEQTSEFVQMMKSEFNDIYARMMEHGRRNISISTVAPTGSLSILAQVSSGLEPVFMLSYKRRKKIVHSEKNAKVDFVDDLGDKWQEFAVYHPKLKTWMGITGETDESKSPYAGSTAPEIDWIKRVKIQSIVQKYTTHSISSTINLPNDVPVEKVGEIYMKSWEMGLKGITVYRDGSRSGVLVENKKEEKETTVKYGDVNAPKRPKNVKCDVLRFTNKGERWIGFVGLLEGRPYEVFTGKAEDMKIPSSIESGEIRKTKDNGVSRYDFVFEKDGEKHVEEGLNRAFDKHYWNYAKLISGVLRHGMPLPYVVDLINTLNLEDDVITTWKNGVSRMIKTYIPDGTVASDKKCKSCGADSVIYQEGCLVCNSCGSTKCG
jgi:ribonucleoside-diphosphate reductase alpha chain